MQNEKLVQATVFLPRDLYEKVEEVSKAEYTSLASVIRRAVAQFIKTSPPTDTK